MKCLIAGVNGFLGSAIARCFVAHGFSVVGADRSEVPPPASLLPRKTVVHRLDLCEPWALDSLVRWELPDILVNAAGCNLPGWLRDPEEGRRANLDLADIVADVAHRRGIALTHVSCKSVYGRPDLPELGEDTPPSPETEFGAEILRAEGLLSERASRGLDVRIVRACAIYGPAPARCPSYVNRRFVHAIASLLRQGEVELVGSRYGDMNELLYVDDFAEATALVATAPRPSGTVPSLYNVGSARLSGLDELQFALSRLYPQARVLHRLIPSEFDSVQPPLRVQRLADAFGWTPRYDLVGGLNALIEVSSG